MHQIRKIVDVKLENIVLEPGNMTKYDLMVGRVTYEGETYVTVHLLNWKGIPNGLFHARTLNIDAVAKRLGINIGDARPITAFLEEYMARPQRAPLPM